MSHHTSLARVVLPYVLSRQACGGWVALNREYKPIGFALDKSYTYEEYPVVTPVKISKAMIKKLSVDGEDSEIIYLYGGNRDKPWDCPKEMLAYAKRLMLLDKIDVVFK